MLLPVRDVVMTAGSSEGLAAHRVTDGRLKWTLPEVSPSAGLLKLTDEQFVAVDADGDVRCYDASTSEPQWSVPAKAEKLLAASSDAKLVFVLTRDGKWRPSTPRRTGSAGRWAPPPGHRRPGRRGRCRIGPAGRLHADGHYFALDSANGDGPGSWAATPGRR